jgi:small-conductance mechanosensitive channel
MDKPTPFHAVTFSRWLAALAVLALLLPAPVCPAAQPSAAGAAKEAVDAVTGGAGGGNGGKVEYPYKDREAPETLRGWADYILDFPLYRTGGEWIRLQELLTALGILILGVWLSVRAGRLLQGLLIRFRHMPRHVAIALNKGLVYLLVFLVVLATVVFAGLPFAVVSLLGAVVLLGASLGAKSTIYDYISGLVLALEQPVRIGDCIEVSDQAGYVEEISGRYTRVRRFDGIDVLVPNSQFLEQEIVNWTLHDNTLRGEVEVGVEYSSDVDLTMDTLSECMSQREGILAKPRPSVLFWRFGESALVFRLFFWLRADNPLDVWAVESELRRLVFRRLHEAGVSVAFPQRDLHLDSREPLRVELGGGPAEGEGRKDAGRSRASAGDQRSDEGVAKPESGQAEKKE